MPIASDLAMNFTLLDHAPIGQLVLDQDFTVLFWNRCMETWTGILRESIVDGNLLDHFPHLREHKYHARIVSVLTNGLPETFSSQLHPHFFVAPLLGNKLRVLQTTVAAVPTGENNYALFTIQDVTSLTEAVRGQQAALRDTRAEVEVRRTTEQKLLDQADELQQLNLTLKEKATRDGLTGLYNHRHFHLMLQRDYLIAKRDNDDLGCMIIDIDFFKKVNDTHGHPCGDSVLREFGELLMHRTRTNDFVARYGGEEFVILLTNTTLEGTLAFAEILRDEVAKHVFKYGSTKLRMTCSIGIATRCAHQPTYPKELLSFADRALYQAKASGRNRVVSFVPSEAEGSSPHTNPHE